MRCCSRPRHRDPGVRRATPKLVVRGDDLTSLWAVSATVAGNAPLSVAFAVRRGSGWQRLAVDTSPPYRAFLDPARFKQNERVQVVAIARSLDGLIATSAVAVRARSHALIDASYEHVTSARGTDYASRTRCDPEGQTPPPRRNHRCSDSSHLHSPSSRSRPSRSRSPTTAARPRSRPRRRAARIPPLRVLPARIPQPRLLPARPAATGSRSCGSASGSPSCGSPSTAAPIRPARRSAASTSRRRSKTG